MFIQSTQSTGLRSSYRNLSLLALVSAFSLSISGCKTMEERVHAFGQGVIRAAEADRQARVEHQQLVEWQNTHNNVGRALPMRPQATQPVYVQPVAPAYSNNPSQQFLNQGMWKHSGQ